jgi:hypothetical protein
MPAGSFAEFKAQALAEGFDEVLERSWPADAIFETHTHPFAVRARVVRGEMWLSVDGQTEHLQAGDEFALAPGVPHAERYGHAGATYWVARRN